MSIQPQQPQYNPYGPLVRPTSGLATTAMIMGILGLCMGFPAILAVILGHMAYGETKNGQKAGHGLAITGLVLGYIIVGLGALFLLMVIVGAIAG